jgi:hypothetical protein
MATRRASVDLAKTRMQKLLRRQTHLTRRTFNSPDLRGTSGTYPPRFPQKRRRRRRFLRNTAQAGLPEISQSWLARLMMALPSAQTMRQSRRIPIQEPEPACFAHSIPLEILLYDSLRQHIVSNRHET